MPTVSLPFTSASDRLLDEATSAADGLSGAQVRQVAFLALKHAILRITGAEDYVRLERDDVAGAIGCVAAKKDGRCGFQTARQS